MMMLALTDLLQGHAPLPQAQVSVDGLVEDSRQVVPGNGYLALRGAANDGHAFAPAAVANGAGAVLANNKKILKPLASLRLTVGLMLVSIFLIFAGTLAQVDSGIWTVLHNYFRTWTAWIEVQAVHVRK